MHWRVLPQQLCRADVALVTKLVFAHSFSVSRNQSNCHMTMDASVGWPRSGSAAICKLFVARFARPRGGAASLLACVFANAKRSKSAQFSLRKCIFPVFFSWLIKKKKKKAKIAISFRKKRNLERDDAAQCCSMIGHHMIRVLDFNFCRIEACFYQRSANISRRVLFLDEKLRERKRKEEKRKKGDDRAVNAVSLSLLLARERFNFSHLSASR